MHRMHNWIELVLIATVHRNSSSGSREHRSRFRSLSSFASSPRPSESGFRLVCSIWLWTTSLIQKERKPRSFTSRPMDMPGSYRYLGGPNLMTQYRYQDPYYDN